MYMSWYCMCCVIYCVVSYVCGMCCLIRVLCHVLWYVMCCGISRLEACVVPCVMSCIVLTYCDMLYIMVEKLRG